MEQKVFILQNKGMNRDLSISKVGESSAYDNHNIRITAKEKNTLFSITNERGNKEIFKFDFDSTLVGYGVLNSYVLLFLTNENDDFIYRLDCSDDTVKAIKIYQGNLNFDTKHPLETIVDYETEDIQKIYWIDGRNVLRFLNFSDTYLKEHLKSGELYDNPVFVFENDDTWFDSTRAVSNTPIVTIEKDNTGNNRPNGVAQYFLTYFNTNGQQTGIVYASPLVYLAPIDRGGAADEVNSNRIVLTISGVDTTFENIYLYQIIRTSLDSQSVAYLLGSVKTSAGEITFVDDGSHLESVDPTTFLYLGSQNLIAETMTQKDGTLFLGNLKSTGTENISILEQTIKENAFILSGEKFIWGTDWESDIVSFKQSNTKDLDSEVNNIPYITASGYYPYNNQLQYTNAQISTFKGGEKYRFGLQFIRDNGTRSKAFWIGDKVNPYYPKIQSNATIARAVVQCILPDAIIKAAIDSGFSGVQLMIAQATVSDRSVLAQGIINPTVFNLYDRYLGNRYTQASWIYRPKGGNFPNTHLASLLKSNNPYSELQCSYWDEDDDTPCPLFYNDKDNKLYNKPYGYSEYTYITIKYVLRAQTVLTKYWGTLTVSYFKDGATKQSTPDWTKDYGLGGGSEIYNNSKLKVVSDWLEAQEDANVPIKFRLLDSDIKAICENALDASNHKVEGTPTDFQRVDFSASDNKRMFSKLNREYFFVDENIVTLNSPEIEYESVSFDKNSGLKFRIVGAAKMTGNITDYTVEATNANSPGEHKLLYNFSNANISDSCEGLGAWPLYSEYGYIKSDDENIKYEKDGSIVGYMTYMWHKNGSIPSFGTDESLWSNLSRKCFANLHFSQYTVFNDYNVNSWSVTPNDVRQINALGVESYEVKKGSDKTLYSGDVEDLIIMPENIEYPVYFTKSECLVGSTPSLTSVKTVSDPVSLVYRSNNHAVISLPTVANKETLLPYLYDRDVFTMPDEIENTTGPFAPWTTDTYSGCTLLYRNLADRAVPGTLTEGAYANFEILLKTNTSISMKTDFSSVMSATEELRRLESLQKQISVYSGSRAVYAHLIDKDSTVWVVDTSKLTIVKTTVKTNWDVTDKNKFTVHFESNAKIEGITLYLTDNSQARTILQTITADVSAYDYTFDLSNYKITTYSQSVICFYFVVTYATSIFDKLTGESVKLITNLDTSNEPALAYPVLLNGKTEEVYYEFKHCAYIKEATYYSYKSTGETDTFEQQFVNIATTPASYDTMYVTESEGEFIRTVRYDEDYSTKYPTPSQSKYSLPDNEFFTGEDKYLFVGEIYKDYDEQAKTNIALDTRYGGVTENAVENNTFITAGPKRLLTDLSDGIQLIPTCKLAIDQLYAYLLSHKTYTEKYTLTLGTETITIPLSDYSISDFLPSSKEKTMNLAVTSVAYQAYVTELVGATEEYQNAIAESSDYKVVLLRYGYARRGVWRKYVNKFNKVQTSHTARTSNYISMRVGYSRSLSPKRYRVIGNDYLYAGNKSLPGSQTVSCGYYPKEKCIYTFGSEVYLPNLERGINNKHFIHPVKDNTGRTSYLGYINPSRNGITDLYIGLYHKEDGVWKLASNIVQVRGRSDNNTRIWEFEETNIVRKLEDEK